jgi:hypothetical protein
VENGKPVLNFFTSKFAGLSTVKQLNLAKRKYDFSIFIGEAGDEAITLPPEARINL